MIKVGILGCAGRMGRMLVAEALATDGIVLAGGTEAPGSALLGHDLSEVAGGASLGTAITDDARAMMQQVDVAIDFTAPSATVNHAKLAAELGTGLVIGTTGLDAQALAAIEQAASRVPIMRAANMSVGVTLLESLVRRVAKTLGPAYDIEIVEMHHRNKVDAPSGTALALGRAAAQGRGVELESIWRKTRDGQVGARPSGEIGFATLRGGDVIGEHRIIFAGEGERLELTHVASSRHLFAAGAMRAAGWLPGRKPGLYSMSDVLESD